MLLAVLTHVDRNQVPFLKRFKPVSNTVKPTTKQRTNCPSELSRKRLAQFCFANAGRPKEQERCDGPRSRVKAGTRKSDGLCDGSESGFLTDDAATKNRLKCEQSRTIAAHESRNRDTGGLNQR
jgi:hypothetical protein